MSKDEFMEFLYDTYEYTTRLAILSEDSGRVDKVFIESVIAFLVIIGKIDDDVDVFNDIYSINPVIEKVDKLLEDQKFITKYMSALQKLYPEIHLNDNTLSGIVNERFVSLKLSHRFIKKAAFSIKIYQKYGYWLRVTNKKTDVEKKMSIIQFLDECTKITPKILHRFKGLSEIDHKDLAFTTMDINRRISVQYTIDDVEETLAKFNITHGTSSEDVENRKKMMKLYKIKREDLDN
jgi:DNA gyrase/topoisomerase IV subunit B